MAYQLSFSLSLGRQTHVQRLFTIICYGLHTELGAQAIHCYKTTPCRVHCQQPSLLLRRTLATQSIMGRSVAALLLCAPLLAAAAGLAVKRQSITALSQSQISSFKPYTFFASAAYCNPSTTINWSCGANCQANTGFEPIAAGGDGDSVQFCAYHDSFSS